MEPEYAVKNSATPKSPRKVARGRPHPNIQLQLISDIGPELVQRWAECGTITSNGTKVDPVMFRALLSATLRAASFEEADDFIAAYRSLVHSAADDPATVLGFTSITSTFTRTSVWNDLFHSASRREPLIPTNAALSFYNNAGAGSGDTAEYHTASVDQRTEFCESYEDLSTVREYALALVIDAFASAVHEGKAGRLIADCMTRFNMNRFLLPFVDHIPFNIDSLPHRVSTALLKFYDAHYNMALSAERNDLRTRLTRAVIHIASEKPQNVHRFLQSLPNVDLRRTVSRVCLVQRFGINDDINKQPSVRRISKYYLSVEAAENRPNAAFPALLTVFLSAWCASSDLPILHSEQLCEKILRRAQVAKQRDWSNFGALESDIFRLRATISQFAIKVLFLTEI